MRIDDDEDDDDGGDKDDDDGDDDDDDDEENDDNEDDDDRSSMNYSILRISSTSPDAPTAPRFLIHSLVFLLGGGAPRDLLLLGGGTPRGVSSWGPRFWSVLARHSPWGRQTRTAQGEESVEQSGLGNGNGYSECCTGTTVHTLELHRRR